MTKMFAQTWVEAVSMIFGTSTVMTGIILSFLLLFICDMFTIILLREAGALDALLFLDLVGVLLFVAIEWLPMFVGTVLAVVLALMGAYVVRNRVSR